MLVTETLGKLIQLYIYTSARSLVYHVKHISQSLCMKPNPKESAHMPITVSEFNTFYVVNELTHTLYPEFRVYIGRETKDNGKVSYRAGVARQFGEATGRIIIDTDLRDERMEALEALLKSLENIAKDKYEQNGKRFDDDDDPTRGFREDDKEIEKMKAADMKGSEKTSG
jgi:hypothetical protein